MPNPNPGLQNLQWLTWRDFTPGIVTRVGAIASAGPAPGNLGAATLTNTYRCVCLPQGGLTPLPARTFNRSTGTQGANSNVMTGGNIIGPVIETQGNLVPDIYARSTSLHQAYAFSAIGALTTSLTPQTTAGAWRFNVDALDVSTTMRDIETLTQGVNHFSPVWITPYSRYTTAALWPKQVAWSWSRILNTSTVAFASEVNIIPTSTNTDSDVLQSVFTSNPTGLMTTHQARLVMASGDLRTDSSGTVAFMSSGEIQGTWPFLTFTTPNGLALDSASPLIPDVGNFTGIGLMASLTASDLLLIMASGGAILIQGDLGAPIVRRLPNVPSTQGVVLEGCSTPLGFAYFQNYGGAYLWQGGDGAVLISPQLDDDFWHISTTTDVVQQYGGTCAFWRDYILFPNNWCYDTKTQSWWQMELQSTAAYWIWRTNPLTNMLYGFVAVAASGATNLSGWSPVTQAVNYSWQSQPFYPAEDRQVTGMELVLVAQGAGTVTFTVTALDTGETDTIVITTTGTDPRYYRENMNGLSGATMQIRAVADNGSSPAPTIHEFRLGYTVGYPVPAP